jgi:hypothetical protein
MSKVNFSPHLVAPQQSAAVAGHAPSACIQLKPFAVVLADARHEVRPEGQPAGHAFDVPRHAEKSAHANFGHGHHFGMSQPMVLYAVHWPHTASAPPYLKAVLGHGHFHNAHGSQAGSGVGHGGHPAPIFGGNKAFARVYYIGVVDKAWQRPEFSPIQDKLGQMRGLLEKENYREDALESLLKAIIEYLEQLNEESRKKANGGKQSGEWVARQDLIGQLTLNIHGLKGHEQAVPAVHRPSAVPVQMLVKIAPNGNSAKAVGIAQAGKVHKVAC